MGTQKCYLFGAGPGLDILDYDTIEHPRYVINLAALVVPEYAGIITTDYHMLRYFERKKVQNKIYTFSSRHSFDLNLEYVDSFVPIYCRVYSATTAIAILFHLGFDITAYGFDSVRGVEGYASSIKMVCNDFTNLNRKTDHKDIIKLINKYQERVGKYVNWM